MNRKTFNHISVDDWLIPEMRRIDGEPFRLYETPEGKLYPSVTSVLGDKENDGLAEWRARVGEREANKVMVQATTRGTLLHEDMEKYLRNEQFKPKDPLQMDLFLQLRRLADAHIDDIMLQEVSLYSDFLEMAGTLDLLACWDGVIAIIDFKSSNREKSRDWIHGYFMQCAAYAIMVEERFFKPVSRLVVIVACETGLPQVFIERRDDWTKALIETRKKFKEKNGI